MTEEAVTGGSLLREAENALRSFSLRALAVYRPWLDKPYTDAPGVTPWSLSIGPEARRAHDLAMAIRKHLGEPYRMATRAVAVPPLTERDVEAEAYKAGAAAERERIAAELNSRADGLDETVPSGVENLHDYMLVANTLRNTAWAIVHGDQAENFAAPPPEGATDARP
jgi:hypothetical protein